MSSPSAAPGCTPRCGRSRRWPSSMNCDLAPAMRAFGPFALDVLYARAKAKMWAKTERLKALARHPISDFGTRRRPFLPVAALVRRGAQGRHRRGLHRHLQRACSPWTTTSKRSAPTRMNCRWCLQRSPIPKRNCTQSPYKVLQDWQRYYGGNLLIVLPDAFGTASFLRDAPDWVADWTGFRPDSAPPIEGGEKIIAWWREKGVDPRKKLLIFSDGLEVETIERDLPPLQGQGAHVLRLGHQPHQRLSRAARRRRPTASTPFRWSARSPRRMAARRSSCPTIRPRLRAT